MKHRYLSLRKLLLAPLVLAAGAALVMAPSPATATTPTSNDKMHRVNARGASHLLNARQTTTPANAGYLMVHFKETGGSAGYIPDQEQIYFSYSNNSNPRALAQLKRGQPILTSRGVGASGARDPFIYAKQDGSYVVMATDSNISAVGFNFDLLSRQGSKAILFWDSKGASLTSWNPVRRVELATAQMGMAWAPEAILDPAKNQYIVFWSTRLFAANDPNHTGSATYNQIWGAYTSDFKTFGTPFLYFSMPNRGVIDLTVRRLSGSTYVRYFKEEDTQHVRGQLSTNGLFGTWKDIGSYLDSTSQTEGPLVFKDNVDSSKYHIWVDVYGSGPNGPACQGYEPFETRSITTGAYTAISRASGTLSTCGVFKHGRVIPITATQRNQLLSVYK